MECINNDARIYVTKMGMKHFMLFNQT